MRQEASDLSRGGHSGPCGSLSHTGLQGPQTHQTAEVWSLEPGGGETQGHSQGRPQPPESQSGWGLMGEAVAAVTTAALPSAGCPSVRPALPHSPPLPH
jgi:hypothetical protein